MALALASYISGVKIMHTAIVKAGNSREFESMAKVYFGEDKENGFSLFGTDYYTMANDSQLSWIYAENYDYVIIDFGAEYEKHIEEILRCNMKLVLGSVNLWRYEEYLKLCRYLEKIPGSDRWLHIVNGNKDDVKNHLKKQSLVGMKRVMISDPYVIENEQMEFFQKIL